MKIKADWVATNKLDVEDGIGYTTDIEAIPEKPGCYVFYSKYDTSISVLYIGKAVNLRTRIKQQFNNLKLMKGIRKAIKGKKYLMYCEINGTNEKRLNMLEKQLIKYAVLKGHTLLNDVGVKHPYKYQIEFNKGNRDSENIFGRKLFI